MLLISVSVSATENKVYNWYCVRNAEHKQPHLDQPMKFIEQYDGYRIDKKHGDDSQEKVVYLTFDAGYENGNVAKILDVLQEESVSDAFFVLGNLVTSNANLIKRMKEDGHLICNHTYTHKDITKLTKEQFEGELKRLENAVLQCTGTPLDKYFRPPEGRFSQETMKFAQELGYKTIFWSFAYADWDNAKQPSTETAKQKILSNIHNGAVILLHPTSSTNAMILGDVIRELKSQGFRFGTLDELTA